MSTPEVNEFRFPIEQGHIETFARAIGDEAAPYVAQGIAPLTFTMAADHFDPRIKARQDAPPEPELRSFHAEQSFVYHRHPQAGEVLTARSRSGDTWEKQGRRGGQLRFVER